MARIADQDDWDEFASENAAEANRLCVLLRQLLYLAFGDGDPDGLQELEAYRLLLRIGKVHIGSICYQVLRKKISELKREYIPSGYRRGFQPFRPGFQPRRLADTHIYA